MNIVVDTSVIVAVVTNEKHKKQLVGITKGADLIAPASVHWEVGNAFSAMFKRQRITLEQAIEAIQIYQLIPLRFSEVDLATALKLSDKLKVYAYDAYVIGCALKHNSPLISLDRSLLDAAQIAGAMIKEVRL